MFFKVPLYPPPQKKNYTKNPKKYSKHEKNPKKIECPHLKKKKKNFVCTP
jgi:Zn-finger nucleic acid-binding protein